MTAAVLALVLAGTFQAEWSFLESRYELPALTIAQYEIGGDALALNRGIGSDGRALVVLDPKMQVLPESSIRKTAAHEALHSILRDIGVPYMDNFEERIANMFAYCWIGDPLYVSEVPCESVLSIGVKQ